MGLRGVWAGLRREAAEELRGKRKRSLPWKRKGLGRAERVIAFLEFLPITKGILAGSKMRLLPDQRAFVMDVYGRKVPPRIAIYSEPRGNGKTGLIAGLELCHLLGPEAEKRGECESAAIDRQQAAIIFNEMEATILAVPEFACRVNIQRFHKKIEVLDGDGAGSTYEALSADARRAHGLAPSFWAYDELAQAKDRVLLDNLQTAMGKRKRSLGVIISTQAPTDDHPLSQLIDDGITGTDPSMVVHLLSAPADADPFDPMVIRSVNPAFDRFLNAGDVLAEAERARRLPGFEPAFRNLRLNQRCTSNAEDRLCTAAVWKNGNHVVNRERLAGRKCFAALDLSGKHDLTSLTLAFPDDADEPTYDILPFFWTPEGQLNDRRPAERDRFREWIRAGLIIPVPGPTIRFGFVARELVKLSAEFDILVLGYDRWRIDDFQQDLAEADADFPVPLEPFGQGFKEMGPAVEWFAELALTGRLRHGGHPVLTACVAGAILTSDPAGNQKIDKDRSSGRGPVRIDGAVTLCMALELAKRFVPDIPVNVDLAGWLAKPAVAI